jgi:hypothetical protein
VTVLPASFLIEFLRAEADLVFELLWFARDCRWRFLRGIFIHGKLLRGERTLEHFFGQFPKNGAVRLPTQCLKATSASSAEATTISDRMLLTIALGGGVVDWSVSVDDAAARRVNQVQNNDADCSKPVEASALPAQSQLF